jgi:TolB-like protein
VTYSVKPQRSMRLNQFCAALCSCIAVMAMAQTDGSAHQKLQRGQTNVVTVPDSVTDLQAGRFFVVAQSATLAKIDLTPSASLDGKTLKIDLATADLRVGQYVLEISALDSSGRLRVLGTISVDVLEPQVAAAAPGQPEAPKVEAKPEESPTKFKLDVGVKAQIRDIRNADAPTIQRPTFTDVTIEGGVETTFVLADWEVKGSANISGSSYRAEALQFSEKAAKASKIDLKDYLLEGTSKDKESRVSLGHISVTSNPLVLQGFSNRGISAATKIKGVDVNASMQVGAINQVGIQNLLGLRGLESDTNSFKQLGVGLELVPDQPGLLRVDVSTVNAARELGYLSTGARAVERSQGAGMKIAARTVDSKGKLEIVVANSQHTPSSETPRQADSGNAWTTEIGYQPIKDLEIRPALPVTVGGSVRVEHSSPLYHALGSSFGTNYHQTTGTVDFKLGNNTLQVQDINRFDNVGNDYQYMRNVVSNRTWTGNFPLADFYTALTGLWSSSPAAVATKTTTASEQEAKKEEKQAEPPKPSPWWPALTFTRKVNHGYGNPDFIPSGYSLTDLPNMLVREQSWGLKWGFDTVQFGVKRAVVFQDNLQPGVETQDSRDYRWGMSLDWKITDKLNVGYSLDTGSNMSYGTATDAGSVSQRVSSSYTLNELGQISGEFNRNISRSNTVLTDKQDTYQLQWTGNFKAPTVGSFVDRPTQFYLRLVGSRGYTPQNTGTVLKPRIKSVQAGMTISMF